MVVFNQFVSLRIKDERFASEFRDRNGITILSTIIQNGKGNVLAYSLGALQAYLTNPSHLSDCKDPVLLDGVFLSMFDTNLNVAKCAVGVIQILTKCEQGNSSDAYRYFEAKKFQLPYNLLLKLLENPDISLQTEAFGVINNFLTQQTNEEKLLGKYDDHLHSLGLKGLVTKLCDTESKELKIELYRYQVYHLFI